MSQIILFEDTGELCNRLVTYSYLLSFAKEYSITITNLCFWRYARYFRYEKRFLEQPWLKIQPKINNHYRKVEDLSEQILLYFLQYCCPQFIRNKFTFQDDIICKPKELIDRSLNAILSRVNQKIQPKGNIFNHYTFKTEKFCGHNCAYLVSSKLANETIFTTSLIDKHSIYLRSKFQLNDHLQSQINSNLFLLRQQFSILVGVHIRRGDYKIYKNGKWYFTDNEFLDVMLSIEAQFNYEKVGFILASNDSIDLNYFASLKVFKSPGDFIKDLYTLAGCDLIIGPPSTFSGWASFVGNTPIQFMTRQKPKNNLNLNDFTIWQPSYF